MKVEFNVIDNLMQAISILNKTDEYLYSLNDKLSECDSLNSDFEHLIEFTPIEEINLKELYRIMQELYQKRRKIKNDMTIGQNYKNNIGKLQEIKNREMLVQIIKNVNSRNGNLVYSNRILNDEIISRLMIYTQNKRGRGRPKRIKLEELSNV